MGIVTNITVIFNKQGQWKTVSTEKNDFIFIYILENVH